MRKIDLKTIKSKLLEISCRVGSHIELHTWYFTAIFFTAIFFVSLLVWWNCVQNPSPSSEVLIRVEQGKEDYDGMRTRTESVIKMLRQSKQRFDSPPLFNGQRELFLKFDPEDPTVNGKFIEEQINEDQEMEQEKQEQVVQ